MLTFRAASVVRQGTALANPYLSERLSDRIFGDWTISAQAMNLMEREIRERPPRRVLEFGSGLSTACLARYMTEYAPDSPRPAVVSVEEGADFCAEARALIAGLGLDEIASIHHAPLVRKDVAGRSVNAYDLPAGILTELDAKPADLVFIDGPGGRRAAAFRAGRSSHRAAPAPRRLPLLSRRRALGLRSRIRTTLGRAPRRDVAGVALVGHGVLVGEFRP